MLTRAAATFGRLQFGRDDRQVTSTQCGGEIDGREAHGCPELDETRARRRAAARAWRRRPFARSIGMYASASTWESGTKSPHAFSSSIQDTRHHTLIVAVGLTVEIGQRRRKGLVQ